MKVNYKEVAVVVACPICGHAHEIEVNEMDYFDWQDGALVQDAFPYLPAETREMLISGICPKCWDKMLEGVEDEEEPADDPWVDPAEDNLGLYCDE